MCSFSRIGQKIKNYSSFNFLAENLEKCRSTELYGAPLEGSTFFLYCSSMHHTALESCQLAELKYAIFSRTGRKTKKLRHSNLFPSTIFNYGLLEGSTFFLIQLHKPYTVGKLSIRSAKKYNFSKIGPKTKKVMAFDNSDAKAV